jgi:Ser-tRNA(Ala) deacylase AlaX
MTRLTYLDDMFLDEAHANVVDVSHQPEGLAINLDQTIFYPQGGGQASDTGTITGPQFAVRVLNVKAVDERVVHQGELVSGPMPAPGDRVVLALDRERRHLNSLLQSAGHLLVNAVRAVDEPLSAKKGYHFPDGPYVEFDGTPKGESDDVIHRIQVELDRLIEADLPISVSNVSADEALQRAIRVPPHIASGARIRIITIDGLSQPCGGTHVATTAALRGMRIRKIKSRKSETRISYSVSPGHDEGDIPALA